MSPNLRKLPRFVQKKKKETNKQRVTYLHVVAETKQNMQILKSTLDKGEGPSKQQHYFKNNLFFIRCSKLQRHYKH